MKRIALYFGVAAALAAACSIQEENFEVPQDDVIFYASFEQPFDGTRVYANEDLYLRWNADDRVSIFEKNTYNQEFRFTGESGDNAGGFKKVGGNDYYTGNGIPDVVSVYPYQESTKITESEVLTVTLPAEQHYAENTFGLGSNTMVAVSSNSFLQYKNVGGYLRISLFGEGVSVSSITLKGNNGEKLAGKATITMSKNGTPAVSMSDDATDEITLVCDSPVTLGASADEGKDFWFVVPPITFSKGFTVSVNQILGGVFEKSTSKSITIERSKLSKMSPMEVGRDVPTVHVPEAIDLGLPSGLKWASFNLGASTPEEYGNYYAWGETEPYYSNLDPLTWKPGKEAGYDWPSYKWCMGTWTSMIKYCSSYGYGYNGFTDGKTVLDLEDDAASVNHGDKWRMPTYEEITELMHKCTWKWTTQNGVCGHVVTGPNGNSIFLPADGNGYHTILDGAGSFGNYWSSSLNTGSPRDAYLFGFDSYGVDWGIVDRYYGFTVRPVYGEFISVEGVSLNKTSLSLLAGSTEQLTVSISPSNATEMTVTWISSDTSVATVCDGVVTAVSAGSATITVWASDGVHSATCVVTVREQAPVPEAVDLGLPSGLKWASFNIGASQPGEYGDYYAWGETDTHYIDRSSTWASEWTWKEGRRGYNWESYKWCNGSNYSLTKYCTDNRYGTVDNKTVLEEEDDVARVTLGSGWRIPTDEEWTELRTLADWTWTTENGVKGYKVTGPNKNCIFLPAAGNRESTSLDDRGRFGGYWSSSLYTEYSTYTCDAWFLRFSSARSDVADLERCFGHSIRPVSE